MKCDLHVHTRFSGMCTIPLLRRSCLESYNQPQAVYETLKRRGMHLVTVTDHDAIGAGEELRRHPDFFLSEEVTCILPTGNELHVGVYDISESQHIELQRRRNDLPSFTAYLSEQHLFASANHVFSGLTGERTVEDFRYIDASFPALEVRNGQMPASVNAHANKLAQLRRKAIVAGSDGHTLSAIGKTYIEIPRAQNKREFFDQLRAGAAHDRGEHGSYSKLTFDVLHIGASWIRESRWAAIIAPLALAAPAVTLATRIAEAQFARKWSRELLHIEKTRSVTIPALQ